MRSKYSYMANIEKAEIDLMDDPQEPLNEAFTAYLDYLFSILKDDTKVRQIISDPQAVINLYWGDWELRHAAAMAYIYNQKLNTPVTFDGYNYQTTKN